MSDFNYQEGALYADVTATPVAQLDRSRYLLLLWNNHQHKDAEQVLSGAESDDVIIP